MRHCLFGLLAIVSVAQADDIRVDVTHERNNTYTFDLQFTAHASARRVHAVITDFKHLAQLNPLIKHSRVLPRAESDKVRVELLTQGCVFFYCKKITRVEEVQTSNPQRVETIFVPELSDFKSGETRWTFAPAGDSTRVQYHVSMVPDFWLPPFVGPYILKKQLHSQLRYTAEKINYLLASDAYQ